jgi:hypothetical protein
MTWRKADVNHIDPLFAPLLQTRQLLCDRSGRRISRPVCPLRGNGPGWAEFLVRSRSGEGHAVDGRVEDLGGVRGPQGDAPGRQLGRDLQGAARVGRNQQGRLRREHGVGLP